MEEKVKATEEKVQEVMKDATEALEEKATDVKEALEETAAETTEKVAEAKETLQEKIQSAKETVQEKAAEAKDTLKEKAAEAMEDVKETAEGVAKEAEDIKSELKGEKKEEPVAAAAAFNPQAPAFKLPTGRGLLKWIFLGIITLGIYNLVILTKMSGEINTVASKHDGKSTMNYCLLVFIITGLTLGIGQIVWWHRICNRLGNELKRRNINFEISASTWWGWNVLGALLFGIGPLVFIHKFCKGFNLMNADYNEKG